MKIKYLKALEMDTYSRDEGLDVSQPSNLKPRTQSGKVGGSSMQDMSLQSQILPKNIE